MVRRFYASGGEEVFISFETEPIYWNIQYIEYCARWWIWWFAAACWLVSATFEPFYCPIQSRRRTGWIAGFLRLRFDPIPGGGFVPELRDAALIRELHVYGSAAAGAVSSQHKGLGKQLVRAAEKIARADGWRKMAIISGVGVREYYREKLGYNLEGTYMTRNI
jgi:GNAT superfamily N-acetyltransferase